MFLPQSTPERRRQLYVEAVAAIAEDCGPWVTVDAVARRIGTSRRQLQRCFAEVGRTTFRAHLTAARMERAAALLAADAFAVGTVARYVGFADPSQFSKAFRRHHGVTPSAFRRRPRSRAATRFTDASERHVA